MEELEGLKKRVAGLEKQKKFDFLKTLAAPVLLLVIGYLLDYRMRILDEEQTRLSVAENIINNMYEEAANQFYTASQCIEFEAAAGIADMITGNKQADPVDRSEMYGVLLQDYGQLLPENIRQQVETRIARTEQFERFNFPVINGIGN